MMKKLETVNVGFLTGLLAQQYIAQYTGDGWGIDAMVEDKYRDTWITFYRYEQEQKMEDFGTITNGHIHAFPTGNNQSGIGLTKREYFAIKILQGIISFSDNQNVPSDPNLMNSVKQSIKVADWLLEQLENS